MKLANIGSRAKFDSNISHLQFKETVLPGEHEGNKFEVFLPEEISMPSQSSQSSQTGYAQKQVRLVTLETSQTRQGTKSINTEAPSISKTFIKDNTKNDDEGTGALSELSEKLDAISRKLTGKGLLMRESKR